MSGKTALLETFLWPKPRCAFAKPRCAFGNFSGAKTALRFWQNRAALLQNRAALLAKPRCAFDKTALRFWQNRAALLALGISQPIPSQSSYRVGRNKWTGKNCRGTICGNIGSVILWWSASATSLEGQNKAWCIQAAHNIGNGGTRTSSGGSRCEAGS